MGKKGESDEVIVLAADGLWRSWRRRIGWPRMQMQPLGRLNFLKRGSYLHELVYLTAAQRFMATREPTAPFLSALALC